VQTCTRCNTPSPDAVQICPNCQADLREFSTTAVTLKKFQANPRVSLLRVIVPEDACPACMEAAGTYKKAVTPRLPVEGCSEPGGCRAFYEPLLNEIYP